MIYLIRHGEPAAGRNDGADFGLSDLGRKQAEAVAQVLAEDGAKHAVTSPMACCRETAKPFERLMETHARLETAVGDIRSPPGLAAGDRPAWLNDLMAGNWAAGNWADAWPGLDAWRRSLLSAVAGRPDGTAVFSHEIAINAIVGLLTGDDRVVIFKPAHCSITRLVRRSGKLEVLKLGSEGAAVLL